MKLVIDRQKWMRGGQNLVRGHENAVLLGVNENMCCLGFYGRQCGLTKARLLNMKEPMDVNRQGNRYDQKNWNKLLDLDDELNSVFAIKAMHINDDDHITESTRERKLTALFKRHGITVKFIN